MAEKREGIKSVNVNNDLNEESHLTEDTNLSNVGAWSASSAKRCCPCESRVSVNLQRSIDQAFVLLVYEKSDNIFGKVRNSIVASTGILRAYGHGEFIGLADETTIDCVEGDWGTNEGLGILSFDNPEEAYKCIDTKSNLHDFQFYRNFDIYIVPLCNPAKPLHVHRYFQLDICDVKNRQNFASYIREISKLVQKHDGLVIAATEELQRMGSQDPHYFLMIQWTNRSDFENYNRLAASLLRDAGAACSSRIFFRIEAGMQRMH